MKKPTPLYPSLAELSEFSFEQYPSVKEFLDDGPDWRVKNWGWGKSFLSYVARNKSEQTYTRFRSEIEKFMLWAFLVHGEDVAAYKKSTILLYIDFCRKPNSSWLCVQNYERFVLKLGCYTVNKDWRPMRISIPKSEYKILKQKLDHKNESVTVQNCEHKYVPSQGSYIATFTAITSFYDHLNDEELLYGNPSRTAKKDCKHIEVDAEEEEPKTLSEFEWNFLISTAEKMVADDPKFHRNLFLLICLKTLFLRISELSETPSWAPKMEHFFKDSKGSWWFRVKGKGQKKRRVTVPDSMMPYLQSYRLSRDLPPTPQHKDKEPVISKIRGVGGMTSRQLTRLVQEVFDKAHQDLKAQGHIEEAKKFEYFSAHCLRHTGASMEVARGRPLKDLSMELGHATMSTTDKVYVHADMQERAKSGVDRPV